jgi:hypothetical protein
MQQHNLKVDAGMRSKTRSDARGKYRDEPNPNTSTVANRAGKTESVTVAEGIAAFYLKDLQRVF